MLNYPFLLTAFVIFCAVYLIFIMALFAIYFFLYTKRSRQKHLLKYSLVYLPTVYLVAFLVSLLYYNERPFIVGDFNPLAPKNYDNGFPSDHTLFATAIAMIMFQYKKGVGFIFITLAVLVGLGRVFAGVHHHIDIITAFIISVAVGYIISKLLKTKTA